MITINQTTLKQLVEDQDAAARSIAARVRRWHRKPDSFDEVKHTVRLTKAEVLSLPVYTAPISCELADFHDMEGVQIFVFKHGKDLFLVDTQGFCYPRYIVKIELAGETQAEFYARNMENRKGVEL